MWRIALKTEMVKADRALGMCGADQITGDRLLVRFKGMRCPALPNALLQPSCVGHLRTLSVP